MDTEPRFEIRFDVDARAEYERLDGSILRLVNARLEDLESRADQIGKVLVNKHGTELHGCKELKLRKIGIRIVFLVTDRVVHVLRVVQVIAIERREGERVFKIASCRYSKFRGLTLKQAEEHLSRLRAWRSFRKD